MLLEPVYIQRLQKLLEGSGTSWKAVEVKWKVIEGNGRLWNLVEVSRKRENVPQVS